MHFRLPDQPKFSSQFCDALNQGEYDGTVKHLLRLGSCGGDGCCTREGSARAGLVSVERRMALTKENSQAPGYAKFRR